MPALQTAPIKRTLPTRDERIKACVQRAADNAFVDEAVAESLLRNLLTELAQDGGFTVTCDRLNDLIEGAFG